MSEIKNLFFATILSIVVLTGWQYFYESKHNSVTQSNEQVLEQKENREVNQATILKKEEGKELNKETSRIASSKEEIKPSEIKSSETKQINQKDLLIKTNNNVIDGAFSRQGLIFNQVFLKKYKENLDSDSPEVKLIDKKDFYYGEIAFLPDENTNIELPNKNTIWEADSDKIEQNKPVNLSWLNKDGIKFIITITLDDNYLFKIDRKIINSKNESIDVNLITRIYKSLDNKARGGVGHEGVIGFFDKELLKITYNKLLKQENITLKSHNNTDKLSWVGFGDKYWMSTIIANEKRTTVSMKGINKDGDNIAQIETKYSQAIDPNEELNHTEYLFFGAKELSLLDKYESEKKILMFDHAVDFGTLYFITKPIFLFLQFLHKIIGNFGIAIMILTLVIKTLLFPLTKKSLISMNRMRKLQPQLDDIKSRHKDNKTAMNLEIVSLFRSNKISPFSSILPMILQIPIFFALYKVLYITIEMRQAPFFGWIKDLSAKDTFNIFSIFDSFHINLSQYLSLGVLSLILGVTMLLQQKTQPKPSDPNQANVLKWMPLIFTIASASFPAGLVIYWSWNNILSIAQQLIVEKSINKSEKTVKIEKVK